ncbi:MAG: histidine phosphatase family protein [Spirochaetes bacterium]|nr:histidine phosphatase family protein [Spirochaetota bacterium]
MIYLIRHGQTEWNEKKIFRGHKDIPLSKEGKEQAYKTGKYLARSGINIIYSSPLKRAHETSLSISEECGCDVNILNDLTDIHFGDWEGKSLRWVKENDSYKYNLYRFHPEKITFPNGESLNHRYERALDGFYSLVEQKTGTWAASLNLAIVTHRVTLKLILLGVLELSPSSFWKIQIDTCSISEVEFTDNGYLVRRLNSTCHFEDQGSLNYDF